MKAILHSGQRVVCIHDDGKFKTGKQMDVVVGEEYEIDKIKILLDGLIRVTLKERPRWQYYSQYRFAPIEFDKQVDELVNEAFELNKETV